MPAIPEHVVRSDHGLGAIIVGRPCQSSHYASQETMVPSHDAKTQMCPRVLWDYGLLSSITDINNITSN